MKTEHVSLGNMLVKGMTGKTFALELFENKPVDAKSFEVIKKNGEKQNFFFISSNEILNAKQEAEKLIGGDQICLVTGGQLNHIRFEKLLPYATNKKHMIPKNSKRKNRYGKSKLRIIS